MSDQTQNAFETAMADVFEGREVQFGDGPKRMLRQFYDRAQKDVGGSTATSRAKIGQSVRGFSSLQVGDVFLNDYLVGESRCRRVTQVRNSDTVITEYVNTSTRAVERTMAFSRGDFETHNNYRFIADPDPA